MQDERLNQEWKRWLRTMYWDYFVTGSFEDPISATAAVSTAKRWLARYPHVYGVIGVQQGPIRLRDHVHLLIGGVDTRTEVHLRASWIKGGHVQLKRYVTGGRAINYIVDQAHEIELLGNPLPFRPKRKRRCR